MISFLLCVVALIVGYLLYGKLTDKIFRPDDRTTPAVEINDGVDYVPMPTWKVFLIQLLNIAGTGPIFGALGGAIFGPIVYLWIVFGNRKSNSSDVIDKIIGFFCINLTTK